MEVGRLLSINMVLVTLERISLSKANRYELSESHEYPGGTSFGQAPRIVDHLSLFKGLAVPLAVGYLRERLALFFTFTNILGWIA